MKYFTSDLHFNHAKIVDFCPDRVFGLDMSLMIYHTYKNARDNYRKSPKCPVVKTAFFAAREALIKEHNECLVKAINKHVRKRDQLYILGDFGFGNVKDLKKWLYKLNGQKILILGNHDRDARVMLEMGFHAVYENHYIDICGKQQRIYMSHFPYFPTLWMRFKHWYYWRKKPDKRYLHKRIVDVGNVLIHGHTHDSFIINKYNKRQIHIGIDAWYKPVSEEKLLQTIKEAK